MDYAIIGGDARMAYLAELLKARENRVNLAGRQGTSELLTIGDADRIVMNWPSKLRGSLDEGVILENASRNARLYLIGPKHPAVYDPRVFDLWSDEALLKQNAWLTAEGALSAAMKASPRAIHGMPVLIVGWGRIGGALTELLVGIGARVTVASRSPEKRCRAIERGAEVADTAEIEHVLPGHRLIFNTAPEMVLETSKLKAADRDAMLIDLASPPYGIDLRAAWQMGLRAWREPGIPGRYCPESAAVALLEAIERTERRK